MNKTSQKVSLPPLHGVQLKLTKSECVKNLALPFHLNVTIEYDNKITIPSPPIWQMIDQGQRYSSRVELFSNGDLFTLSVECEGSGTFTFDHESMCINWQSSGTNYAHYLQSLGIAAWLELKHIPCIHANAITLDKGAALVIAPSRTGKSTLTSHLLHHGFKLMTDDMAAIYPCDQYSGDQCSGGQHAKNESTFEIFPSWPKVRLWPDMLDSLVGMEVDGLRVENKARSNNDIQNSGIESRQRIIGEQKKKHVHQKFAKYEIEFEPDNNVWETSPKPLKAIYYLERLENEESFCQISPVSPSTGLIILLQNSMLADAYRSMGVEMERLANLAKITETIPIFRISYTSGLNNLVNVGNKLKEHLRSQQ